MALDVATPDPPDLTNREPPAHMDPAADWSVTDLRRAELEAALREGAWEEAFREWAEYTDLTEAEYRTVRDRGLLERLDVYWDPEEERLRVETPSLPGAWPEEGPSASVVERELSDLGDAVVEMLADGYVDWADGAGSADWNETTGEEGPDASDG